MSQEKEIKTKIKKGISLWQGGIKTPRPGFKLRDDFHFCINCMVENQKGFTLELFKQDGGYKDYWKCDKCGLDTREYIDFLN